MAANLKIFAELLGHEQVHTGLQKINNDLASLGNQADASFVKAEKSATQFQLALSKTLEVAGKAAAAVTAVAATAFVGWAQSALRETMRLADELDNLSDRLGVSAEALQSLSAIGMDLGITLDDISGALGRLGANAGRTATAVEENADAFERYGIQVKDANGQTRDLLAIFLDTADVIQGLETNTEKLAAATALYGREGTKLVPILNKGSVELLLQAEEAKRLGLVLSDELVEAAADAGDALERWSTRMQNYLAIGTFEVLKFLGVIERTRRETLTMELESLEELRTSTLKGIDRATEDERYNVLAGLGKQLQEVETKIAAVKTALADLDKPIVLPGLPEGDLPGFGGGGGGGLGDTGGTDTPSPFSPQRQALIADMSPLIERNMEAWEKYSNQLQAFANQGLKVIQSPLERLAETQNQLNQAVEAGFLTTAQATDIYDAYASKLTETAELETGIISGLEGVLTNFGSMTVDTLLQANKSWEDFADGMKGVAEAFIAEILKMILYQTIFAGMGGSGGGGGLFGSLFGSLFGGGTGIYAQSAGAFYGGGAPVAGGLAGLFQTGGEAIVTRPSLIAVGEVGPEKIAVEPLTGRRGGGSDGAPTYVLNFHNVAGDTHIRNLVREGIKQSAPGMIEASAQTVRQRYRMDPGYLR